MTDFQPGEIISIAVPSARIERVTMEGHDADETLVAQAVVVGDDGKSYYITVPLKWDTVTVERVAPAEWPPQLGDLWRDRDGILWFGVRIRHDGDVFTELRCQDSNRGTWTLADPADILREFGPLTLVHREEASS